MLLGSISCVFAIMLAGCGSSYTVTGANGIGPFQASTDAVDFGNVPVGQTADSSLTLVNQGSTSISVSDLKVTGNDFAVGNTSALPITVAANSTYSLDVQFKPKANGTSTGQLTVSSSSKGSPSLKVKLHGNGAASNSATATATATLSSLSCSQSSFTGSGSDSCMVTLTGAAGNGGLIVSLGSSNNAVSVPASVTISAGASSAGFTAAVSAVTSAQSTTLTASAGGATQTYSIGLSGYASESSGSPALQMSSTSLNFGSIAVNTESAPQSVTLTSSGTAPLTIGSASITGAGFSMSGITFPVTLDPGQTATLAVTFDPKATGSVNGSISIGNNASPSSVAVSLSGTGQAAAGTLSGLSCSQSSITGSGSDSCTVSLSSAAGTGGLAVTLSSSNSAVAVPASITVPAGSSSVGFAAAVSAVTTAQTDTLTASAGGVTKNYAISLGAPGRLLSLGASSVSFGNVNLSTPATQSVTLTSSGSAALTISTGTVTGTGFSISGVSFPTTLNPGQTATLYIQFDPTTAGSAAGTVTLTSDASPATATIALSGNGQTNYLVNLTWNAPTGSADPVTGYNVYRAIGGNSSYLLLNSSVNAPTSFTDTTVQNGTSYTYYVKSVDAQGNQSVPSNTYTANIP